MELETEETSRQEVPLDSLSIPQNKNLFRLTRRKRKLTSPQRSLFLSPLQRGRTSCRERLQRRLRQRAAALRLLGLLRLCFLLQQLQELQ